MYFFSFFSRQEVDFSLLGTNPSSTQLHSPTSSLLVSSHSLSSQRYESTHGILEVQISWLLFQTFLPFLSHSRFLILLPLFLFSLFFSIFVFFCFLLLFLFSSFYFCFCHCSFFVSIWASCHLYFFCSLVNLRIVASQL